MEIDILLSESKVDDMSLYHFTSMNSLTQILRTGLIQLSAGVVNSKFEGVHQKGRLYFASLTRSRFGNYHYKGNGNQEYGAMLTLDGAALRRKFKIAPVDYWAGSSSMSQSDEMEERLLANSPTIDIIPFILRIDLVVRGNYAYTYNGSIRVDDIDADASFRHLNTVELLLKKMHIDYAYYPNMKSWAYRRGEFTPIGRKGVSPAKTDRRVSKLAYKDLNDILMAITLPYRDMSKDQKSLCSKLDTYPEDAQSLLQDLGQHSRPTSHPILKGVVDKISRVMRRLKLDSTEALGRYLGLKYKEAIDAENRARDMSNSDTWSNIFLHLLDLPTESLTERERLLLSNASGLKNQLYGLNLTVKKYGIDSMNPVTKMFVRKYSFDGRSFNEEALVSRILERHADRSV